jgi:hypothetical protein
MTSSSHTNLATWTISESYICKPQKQQKWHVSLFLSFSHDLSSFEMIYSVFGKFVTFFTLSLNSVVVGLDTICNKSYEMIWFESFEWVVCLTQNFLWRTCHACMHGIHARNWIKNMSPLKLHLNVSTMNNHSLRAVRVSITIFKSFLFVEAACRGFFFLQFYDVAKMAIIHNKMI